MKQNGAYCSSITAVPRRIDSAATWMGKRLIRPTHSFRSISTASGCASDLIVIGYFDLDLSKARQCSSLLIGCIYDVFVTTHVSEKWRGGGRDGKSRPDSKNPLTSAL